MFSCHRFGHVIFIILHYFTTAWLRDLRISHVFKVGFSQRKQLSSTAIRRTLKQYEFHFNVLTRQLAVCCLAFVLQWRRLGKILIMPIFVAIHEIIPSSLAVIIRSSECDYGNFLNWLHRNENASFLGYSHCRPAILIFRGDRKVAKSDSCMSVRVYKLGSRWTDFGEVLYWELLLKPIEKIKFVSSRPKMCGI